MCKTDYLPEEIRSSFYCKMEDLAQDELEHKLDFDGTVTLEDAQEVYELQRLCFEDDIDDFDKFYQSFKEVIHHAVTLRKDGRIVSYVNTTAENENSAMLVAVCTHPDERGKGYATQVVRKCCARLQKEGKIACLFYDDEQAGRIYHRLGFVDVDKWCGVKTRKEVEEKN